ncbi:MAG: helix-turn-helix transcriptional regulator [Clostridia bacterium]|nr:helix-turn-helix transcriptional regulator [Clostridia bacterium]
MRDICAKVEHSSAIRDFYFHYFVYEMELRKLPQPFFQSHYYLYLFVCGEGELQWEGKRYPVSPGTLVLVHPWQLFRIVETKQELTYLYVSFSGESAAPILRDIGAEQPVTVYPHREPLLDFWMRSIRRLRESNALYITESVFTYTVSHLCAEASEEDRSMEAILRYVQENLSNPELSLRTVANLFYYNEKYFSRLFCEKVGCRFTDYLNERRMHYALRLMGEGVRSVSELAEACGFASPCYFSKVFKKTTGQTPTAYRRHTAE